MGTSAITPNVTYASTGTTITGAATVHAATNDASDASYVTMLSGYIQVGLGTFTLPAGAVTKSMVLTVRADNGGAGGASDVIAAYVMYSTDVLGQGFSSYLASSATNMVWPTWQLIEATQSMIDSLYIQINDVGYGSRVYNISLSVTYAEQPTCAVSAPTGTVSSTSTPDVSWSHTNGVDGGAQTHYQVKCYTAAQYSAGGFDPDTSTADYDSGEVASTATTAASGTLANSTTYRAYVRTAQTINGSPHWSDWAYSGFSTSFTTSEITTMSAVATDASGLITVTIDRDTATAAWTSIDIERSDDGGTTYSPVRGGTGFSATSTWVTAWAADQAVIVDYEAPNGTTVTYRARANSTTIAGSWVTDTEDWTSTDIWLKSPLTPALNQTIELVEWAPMPTYPITQGVHMPIGRTYPVVISDVRQAGYATLEVETYTFTDADDLKALFDATLLLLQFPTSLRWGSRYIAVGDVEERAVSVATEWVQWMASVTIIDQPADETA